MSGAMNIRRFLTRTKMQVIRRKLTAKTIQRQVYRTYFRALVTCHRKVLTVNSRRMGLSEYCHIELRFIKAYNADRLIYLFRV
jgi:hypothetical protein